MAARADAMRRGGSAAEQDFAVLQQAAEWYALLRSDTATDEDQSRWRAWCDAETAHHQAWQRVEGISRRFTLLTPDSERQAAGAALDLAARTQRRRRSLKLIALFGGGVAAAWIASRQAPWSATLAEWGARYRTGTGETRAIALADGSRVWLNTRSALDVDYDVVQRRLVLHAGEILIETAHEVTRPFTVQTVHGTLRAFGTRFNVQQIDDDSSRLDVFDGAVALRPDASSGEPTVIRAGSGARFTRADILQSAPSDPAREGWARGVLLANDMPLADFIEELTRYRHGHLAVAPEVASLRVVGAYPLNDTDRALAMLEATLPLRVHAVLPWWVSIEGRPGTP